MFTVKTRAVILMFTYGREWEKTPKRPGFARRVGLYGGTSKPFKADNMHPVVQVQTDLNHHILQNEDNRDAIHSLTKLLVEKTYLSYAEINSVRSIFDVVKAM